MQTNMYSGWLTYGLQVSAPLPATSGGTVRKDSLRSATRQTSFTARDPSHPTRNCTPRPPKLGEHRTLTRTSYRLPRPRRPPPRHVLRQARGPESRERWHRIEQQMAWNKQCDDQREIRELGRYMGLNGERCEMYIYSKASGWKRSPLG